MRPYALAAGFLLALTGCAHWPPESPEVRAKRATVVLGLTGEGSCSGTMVAPKVLLTAAHCIAAAHLLTINDQPVVVESVSLDGNDHAWITVDVAFPHTAPMGDPPQQGDAVFIYGNPGADRDLMRRGYVSGTVADVVIYDLPVSFGDSGSAIFNEDGEIVGMVMGFKLYPSTMMLMGAKPFGTPRVEAP